MPWVRMSPRGRMRRVTLPPRREMEGMETSEREGRSFGRAAAFLALAVFFFSSFLFLFF